MQNEDRSSSYDLFLELNSWFSLGSSGGFLSGLTCSFVDVGLQRIPLRHGSRCPPSCCLAKTGGGHKLLLANWPESCQRQRIGFGSVLWAYIARCCTQLRQDSSWPRSSQHNVKLPATPSCPERPAQSAPAAKAIYFENSSAKGLLARNPPENNPSFEASWSKRTGQASLKSTKRAARCPMNRRLHADPESNQESLSPPQNLSHCSRLLTRD